MSKTRPRIMIWAGGPDDKPKPFEYWQNVYGPDSDGSDDPTGKIKTTTWTADPVAPLLYDDDGDFANHPLDYSKPNSSGNPFYGLPQDFTYSESVTCLVHNYNQYLCAIYKKEASGDDNWKKVSPNISVGLQKQESFDDGTTFRVDWVGGVGDEYNYDKDIFIDFNDGTYYPPTGDPTDG